MGIILVVGGQSHTVAVFFDQDHLGRKETEHHPKGSIAGCHIPEIICSPHTFGDWSS